MTTRRWALSDVNSDVLESPAVAVLTQLEADGFSIGVAGDRLKVKPISRLTAEQRADIERYRADLLMLCDSGVQERREAFSRQLEIGGHLGLLIFRAGVPYVPGTCYACGDRLVSPRPGRCWRCALAARLACHAPIAADLLAEYDTARIA